MYQTIMYIMSLLYAATGCALIFSPQVLDDVIPGFSALYLESQAMQGLVMLTGGLLVFVGGFAFSGSNVMCKASQLEIAKCAFLGHLVQCCICVYSARKAGLLVPSLELAKLAALPAALLLALLFLCRALGADEAAHPATAPALPEGYVAPAVGGTAATRANNKKRD
eukprot:c10118_g1_i1.p2 GENE.c10118_g1_i1~~c10118_g1_i1.p2  ORF type:complete len:167 (+),score=29.38 c10118_g1_i1:113-613(+)